MIRKTLAFTLALIILCTLFAACNGTASHLGKYYLYENGVTNKESWFELGKDNTWTDNDGISGSYTIEGEKITLYLFGDELSYGTLKDGCLTLESEYYNQEYYFDGKAPDATQIK